MSNSPVVSVTDELIAELEQLYIAGWEESGEGWNAEYPGDAHETRNFTDRMRKACEPVHKAILAEREELKRDADRYRWLRDKAMASKETAPAILMVNECCEPAINGKGWESALYGEKADAAIDAAMQS